MLVNSHINRIFLQIIHLKWLTVHMKCQSLFSWENRKKSPFFTFSLKKKDRMLSVDDGTGIPKFTNVRKGGNKFHRETVKRCLPLQIG